MARVKTRISRTRRRPKQAAKVNVAKVNVAKVNLAKVNVAKVDVAEVDVAVDPAGWVDGADIGRGQLLDPAWLSFLSEAERRDAFRRAVAGEAVVAARYVPAEDCFGRGIDPLGLMLATPGLIALRASGIATASGGFDPSRCQLRFALLAAAPALHQHWHEELDRIMRWPVAAADLVLLAGVATPAPVLEDFSEQAMAALAIGDYAALKAATATLLGLMGEGLKAVAALRWLSLAIETAVPDRALLRALIEAVGSGHFTAPAVAGNMRADEALAEPPAAAPRPAGDVAMLARNIVAVKRRGPVLDRKELR